jgi:hypothetical protein
MNHGLTSRLKQIMVQYAARGILAPYIVHVATMNDLMLGNNDPTIFEYLSADLIPKDQERGTDLKPPENSHIQNPSNFPSHRLCLRVW